MKKSISVFSGVSLALLSCLFLAGCQSNETPSSTNEKPPVAATAPAMTAQPAPPVVAAPANSVVRIKAGSPAPITDSSGNVWLPDQGFDGGDVADRDAGTVIANTKDAALYLSEHYGMNSFSCKVPNGRYTAKLYFAETFDGISGTGQRVFSFNVQGHEFKDFDVWAKAPGPNRAYIETVPADVTNGVFRIDFTSNIENPEINAIEIIPQS